MKTLEDFRQEILTSKGVKSSGSIPHGSSQHIMEEAAESYARHMVQEALTLILKAIENSQYEATNNLGEATGEWITDIETINLIDFKSILSF